MSNRAYTLDQLVKTAREKGWASIEGANLDLFRHQAGWLGWTVVPSRKDGPPIDALKAKTGEDAPKRSLSAITGTGQQPLHTDGAHHLSPPDLVFLAVEEPSTVPTLLWRFSPLGLNFGLTQDLWNGLFTVRSGSDSFLAPAFDTSTGSLRFDPGCMTPSDSRARRVAEHLLSKADEAVRHEWVGSTMLAIDNRTVLHGRGSADDEPDRPMHRMAVRLPKAVS